MHIRCGFRARAGEKQRLLAATALGILECSLEWSSDCPRCTCGETQYTLSSSKNTDTRHEPLLPSAHAQELTSSPLTACNPDCLHAKWAPQTPVWKSELDELVHDYSRVSHAGVELAGLERKLALGPILVQASQRVEVLSLQRRCVLHGYQGCTGIGNTSHTCCGLC